MSEEIEFEARVTDAFRPMDMDAFQAQCVATCTIDGQQVRMMNLKPPFAEKVKAIMDEEMHIAKGRILKRLSEEAQDEIPIQVVDSNGDNDSTDVDNMGIERGTYKHSAQESEGNE